MQVNDDHSVCQFQTEGSKILTVKVNWFKTHFDLTLFDGVNAYTGTMSEEEILKIISQLGTLTVDDYIKRCRDALTTNSGCEKFIYLIDNNVFQWKKVEFDMKIKLGSVNLTPVPVVDSLHDMLNVLVTNYHQLESKALCLYEERNLLENDNKELLERIDEYTHIKNDMETELCNQFLVVLNTKKRRISQLQKLLKANKIDVSKIPDEDGKTTISDLYECDTEVETDDENMDNGVAVENKKESSSEKKASSKFGMFDSDSEDKITSIPKRNRKKSDKIQVDESETLFIQENSNNQPQSKGANRNVPNKRGSACNIPHKAEAGPSGIKISKVEKQKSDINTNGDSSKKCDENVKDNQVCSDIPKNGNVVCKTSKINEPESSVDDILARLVG